VVHIRHTRVYLYYAKLPNTYLARIAEHGAHYARQFPSLEHKVKLYQSEGYSMKKPEDQAKFYVQLTKLLWYLSSGESHVGYLYNSPRNPFAPKLVIFPSDIDVDG
jgi:hypothetical protein